MRREQREDDFSEALNFGENQTGLYNILGLAA